MRCQRRSTRWGSWLLNQLTASTTVAGALWQAYQVRVDEKALVLTTAQRTIIVIGRADSTELAALATAVS